jgi:hypothetical protein
LSGRNVELPDGRWRINCHTGECDASVEGDRPGFMPAYRKLIAGGWGTDDYGMDACPEHNTGGRSPLAGRCHDLFGIMRVVSTDQFAGRRYRCSCGWTGWTVWGRARKHAQECGQAWPAKVRP